MNGSFASVMQFILETDRLKQVWRKTKPPGFDRPENSAEHSWQVALLAIVLAPYAACPVDVSRVVEILLVHDIPEIDAGDILVYEPRPADYQEAERQAAERIFGLLPEEQARWAWKRWREYEERVTPEAQFAYAVDRLMPLLHNLGSNGRGWQENAIPLDSVLTFNTPIGDILPDVWEQVRSAIEQHARKCPSAAQSRTSERGLG